MIATALRSRPHIIAFVALSASLLALVVHFTAADEAVATDATDAPLRIATFNIELYPKSEEQARGAFDEIAALHADIVAVQEIMAPHHLASTARMRLGTQWQFAAVNHRLATGVLFDSSKVRHVSSHTHTSTVVFPNAIPVFEVRLDDRRTGERVRVFVVHWKAGGDNFPSRRAQMDSFAPILEAARGSGDRVVVLGDFNATSNEDRVRIASLARSADVEWATRAVGCTCFWQRDRDCVGSALDHVLTTEHIARVHVGGGCAGGCPTMDRCPSWRDDVSDHCPVVVDLVRR